MGTTVLLQCYIADEEMFKVGSVDETLKVDIHLSRNRQCIAKDSTSVNQWGIWLRAA